jgi:hypothetical protein
MQMRITHISNIALSVLLSAFITAGSAEAAATSVKCKDNKVVKVTTGAGGRCSGGTGTTGKNVSISCDDTEGNHAKGGCDAKGNAYCDNNYSEGTGDCDIKRTVATPTSPTKPPKGTVLEGESLSTQPTTPKY